MARTIIANSGKQLTKFKISVKKGLGEGIWAFSIIRFKTI